MRVSCLLVLFLTVAVGEERPLGTDGALRLLTFQGNDRIADGQLRQALAMDRPTFLARHPRSPRAGFPGIVAERLTLGYRQHGFPDAEVTVEARDGGWRVAIAEGPRYEAGAVVVEGAVDGLDVEALVALLTEPSTVRGQTRKPAWAAQRPVDFREGWRERLRPWVDWAFTELGRHGVELELAHRRREDGRCDLVVTVAEPGTPAALRALRFEGLEHQDQAAVGEVVADLVGRDADGALLRTLEDALMATGCFVSVRASYEAADDGPAAVVRAREWHKAPPISEGLDELEREALAAAVALQRDLRSGERELRLALGDDEAGLRLVGGRDRFAIQFDAAGERSGFLFAADEIRLRLLDGRGKVVPVAPGTGRPVIQISLAPNDPPRSGDDNDLRFSFNAGWSSKAKRETAATIVIHPVAVLHKVRQRIAVEEEGDGTVLIRIPGSEEGRQGWYRLDRERGLLTGIGIGGAIDDRELVFTFAAPEGWIELVPERPWELDPAAPLSDAAVGYLAQLPAMHRALVAAGIVEDDPVERQRVEAFMVDAQPVAAVLLPGLERVLRASAEAREEDAPAFSIPDEPDLFNPTADIAWMIGLGVNSLVEPLLPVDGWPLTLLRETVLVVTGQGRHTGAELGRLAGSQRVGPVGSWAAAWLLDTAGHHQPAQAFAQRGLQVLHWQGLQADLQELMPVLAPLVVHVAAEDPEGLALALGADRAAEVQRRLEAGERPVQALARLWWEDGGEALLRSGLEDLAGPPAPALPPAGDEGIP